MLHRVPKHMPPLCVMLADIGNPSAIQLAKALGVSRTTAHRWMVEDRAPRPVMLSIFWLTRWGSSQSEIDAHNDAVMQANIARVLKRSLDEALDQVEYLKRIGNFSAANEPTPEPGSRRSLNVLDDSARALLDRQKTNWIGQEIVRPSAKPKSKKALSAERAALAEQRLAERANGESGPFDFLRAS